jgi:hypothetical protein
MQLSHIYTVHVSAVFTGFIMLELLKYLKMIFFHTSAYSMNALKIAEACTVYTCDGTCVVNFLEFLSNKGE